MPTGVSPVASRAAGPNGSSIGGMWMQILFVSIVALVFLVRLVAALYDQPAKPKEKFRARAGS
jgi:hypothetical protein